MLSQKQILSAVIFLVGHALPGAVLATSRDSVALEAIPVWKQATVLMARDGSYWAQRLDHTLTVYNADNEVLGGIETQAELKMDDGQPTWRSRQEKRTGHPGMVITMDLGIQKEPGAVLAEYDAWTLLRNDTIDRISVAVWRGTSSADPRNSATAYFDVASARPLRIDFTLPYKSLLGTQLVSLRLEYRATPEGAWLPWRAVVEHSGRILFMKRRIHLETEYREWRSAKEVPFTRPTTTATPLARANRRPPAPFEPR